MEITLIKKKNADNYSVFNIAGIRKKWLKRDLNLTVNFKKDSNIEWMGLTACFSGVRRGLLFCIQEGGFALGGICWKGTH